jgi:DNA-binding response OmpR family regulator
MAREKILVVEDESELVEILKYNLRREGYEVMVAFDGLSGWQAAQKLPDLVILDLMLPEMDGREVCRRLRRKPSTAALQIIMLTARGEEADIVAGLELGADDYLSKPFRMNELLARVRALLRRTGRKENHAERIEIGPLLLDRSTFQASLDGRELVLTTFEFRLLWFLAENSGRVLSRRVILREISPDRITIDRTVDVHVRRIREKMGPAGIMLETLRGVGYRLNFPEG